MRARFCVLLLLPTVLGPLICVAKSKKADTEKEANALIERARQLSNIRAEGNSAFVLKAEFRILRDPSHPVSGTYTEFWASPSLWRQEISAGDFHSTTVVNNDKRWELSSDAETPKDVSTAANTVAYKLEYLSYGPGAADITERVSASWSLRCVVSRDDGLGGRQERCFDKSTSAFVSEGLPFVSHGGEEISRCAFTDFQKFDEKLFPRSALCLEGERPSLQAAVIELKRQEPVNQSLFTAPPGAKEFPNCPSDWKPPAAIKSPDPAVMAGGPAVFSVVVQTDGRAYDPKVTSAGEQFDKAGLDALRDWRFQPATCAGKPMQTKINVVIFAHPAGR